MDPLRTAEKTKGLELNGASQSDIYSSSRPEKHETCNVDT